jgi:hypothetical protein
VGLNIFLSVVSKWSQSVCWMNLGKVRGVLWNKAGSLWLEPHLQSILLWLLWRWGSPDYLSRLASNCDPPYLSLQSSWDYSVNHCTH